MKDYDEIVERTDRTIKALDRFDAIMARLTADNVSQIREEVHKLLEPE